MLPLLTVSSVVTECCQAARRDVHPYLAKRLHVLSALEIERHRKKTLENAQNQATKAGATDLDGGTQNIAMATAATLESLMMTSLDTQEGATVTLSTTEGARKASKAFGNAWRGAAAYHYQILAQKLFYAGLQCNYLLILFLAHLELFS